MSDTPKRVPQTLPEDLPRELTLAAANQIIDGALQRSTGAAYKPMAVVVIDEAGHVTSAQRQDGASMFRIDIATGKAWASVAMGAASRLLTQRAKDLPAFFGALASDRPEASSSRRPARC